MPTQVPLFRPTRELRFSAADVAAIRAAEGMHVPVVPVAELHEPRASGAVFLRRAIMAYMALVLLVGAHSHLGRLWTAFQDSLSQDPVQSQTEQFAIYRSPLVHEPTPVVPSILGIEGDLNALPLRQFARILPFDSATIQPAEIAVTESPEILLSTQQMPPISDEAENWHPRLQRAADHHSDAQPQFSPVGAQGECPVIAQPKISYPHPKAPGNAIADELGPELETNDRHDGVEAANGKRKAKKPSRLRRVLFGGVSSFEDFVFNHIDPVAEP